MKNLVLTFVAVLVFSSSIFAAGGEKKTAAHAVNIKIENLALLDIRSSGISSGSSASADISLQPTAPELAGGKVDFSNVRNSDLWLNYSSIVVGEKSTRNITVNVDGALPGGTTLVVAPKTATSGNGNRGKAVTSLDLGTEAQILVEGIGSCYTETGGSKGVNLVYTLKMEDEKYEALYNGGYDVKVIYTISD